MDDRDKTVLSEFAAQVRRTFPAARIWAFGSRTRGEATWESDLDVCVVLETVDAETRREISDLAWEIGFDHDVVVSSILFSRDMFEQGPASASPLVHT
ncbi:TPA: nucleotidyltransferase domain-containing protein, partial [Candidatus Sumerlaeota bacterium]|nr:nucleotidyltransferase domain-containing protein [Candidatus Sumerlaeota bacterium]